MNCLRCGRRIDEGKTFCPDCEKLVSQPLPDSPFLDRRIVLTERKATPRQAEKRQREKNERRAARQARAEKRRSRGKNVLIVGLLMLLAVSTAGGLLRSAQLKAALRSKEASLQDNEAMMTRVRDQLTTVRAALRDLHDKQEELQNEYDVLALELASDREKLAQDEAALDFMREHVALFVPGKSRYYHTAGCPDFDETGYYNVTLVTQAVRWGYQPCPICHPKEGAE